MSSQEWCSFCRGGKGPYGLIEKNLNSKYLTGMDYYNVKVVNDIIYNDTTNLVSVFKDYLIYDDISEFMKRYYNNQESKTRLLKIYAFYDKYSKVFPNYIVLEENRYMFKNIERKQIAIDERQQFFQELEEKEKVDKANNKHKNSNLSQLFENDSNQMFDSKFFKSVAQIKTNSQVSDSFPFDVASGMIDSHIHNASLLEESHNKSKAVRLDDSKPQIYQFSNPKRSDIKRVVDMLMALDASSTMYSQSENSRDHDQQIENKIKKYATNINKHKIQNQVFTYNEPTPKQR